MDINDDAAEWAWMGVDKLANSRHFDKIYHRIPNPFSSRRPDQGRRRDYSSSYDSDSEDDSYERPRRMTDRERFAKDRDYRDYRSDYDTDREKSSRRRPRYGDYDAYRSQSRDRSERRGRHDSDDDRNGRQRRRAATVGALAGTGAAAAASGAHERRSRHVASHSTDGPADDEVFRETFQEAQERRSREDFVRSYVETDAFSTTARVGPLLPTVEDASPTPSDHGHRAGYPARTAAYPQELSPPVTVRHAGESLHTSPKRDQVVRSPQAFPRGMFFPPPPMGPPPQGVTVVPSGASPSPPATGVAAAGAGFAASQNVNHGALPPPPLHPPPSGAGFGPGPVPGALPGSTRGTSMRPQYDERSRFRGVQFGPTDYRSSAARRYRPRSPSTSSEESKQKRTSGKGLASAVLGAVAGGLVGSDLTRGDGLATVGAAVAGALASHEAEQSWERRRDDKKGRSKYDKYDKYDKYEKRDKYDRYDKYDRDDRYGDRRRRSR